METELSAIPAAIDAAEDRLRAERFAEFEDRGYDVLDIVDGDTDEGRGQMQQSIENASRWFGRLGLSPDIRILPVPVAVAKECGFDPSLPTLKAVVAYDPSLAA